ncbi:hypothetical protein QBC38DRAFT_482834 [Podospora fimiseda]|uniref:Uncharacterized protein n=1 Tax=Podospora fimiseda TaxID=252190 RepID=A0AAN7BLI8_9PEZI|nr:hypothetical protein QBC38DRAFT_482834 [Podospora fimiseda]
MFPELSEGAAPAQSLTMPTYLGQDPNTLAQSQTFTNFQPLSMGNDFFSTQPLVACSEPLLPVVHEGRRLTHNRKHKYKDNDPSSIYTKPAGVMPWGPMTRERIPQHIFEYNKSSAELLPFKSYSKDELITFFTSSPNPERDLTLWIQSTPAQSNDRYAMGPSSGKCRYKGCPASQKTILKGFFRIAFDEFSSQTGTLLDPFHNAGYMHLHCFEELFDLGLLIHYGAGYRKFRIRADLRHFPYESRNPMALNRDHQTMGNFFNEWVQAQKLRCDQLHQANLIKGGSSPWYDGFHPDKPTPHRLRLGYKLTVSHLSLEVRGRAQARDARGGAHIGKHKGDLDLYMRLKKAEQNAKKRKRGGDDDEDDEDEPEITTVVPRKRARQGDMTVVGGTSSSRPPPLNLPTSAPLAQTLLPESSSSQIPITPTGRRTRQSSRQLESWVVDFLNNRQHLTRRETQQIQTALEDVPEHVQDNVLSAAEPAVADLVAPRNSIGSFEQVNVEKKLGKLSSRQRRQVEKFMGGLEKKGRFYSLE